MSSGNTSQRNKDLLDACQAGRNDEDGSLTHGQVGTQSDDKARKLTSQCKVSCFKCHVTVCCSKQLFHQGFISSLYCGVSV